MSDRANLNIAQLLDVRLNEQVRVRAFENLDAKPPSWAPNAHDTLEVAWVEKGRCTYQVGQSRYRVSAGEAIVIPQQVEHQTTLEPGASAGSVWLSPELSKSLGDRMDGRRLSRPGVLQEGAAIAALGALLITEARAPKAGQRLATEALADALTLQVLRGAGERVSGPTDPRIRAAVDRIESCYAETLSIEMLAKTARMSRFHFGRLFDQHLGMSPYRYLLKVRIDRAATLLQRGGITVTEAATTVGFSDLSRFSKAFKRARGVSPSRFASEHRAPSMSTSAQLAQHSAQIA